MLAWLRTPCDLGRVSLTLPVRCFIVSDMSTQGSTTGTHGLDAPLVDRVQMGRLFRAARILAGHDRVEDAVRAVKAATGLQVSSRTWYALERGEQPVTMDQMLAAAITFRPPTGVGFFRDAVRDDVKKYLAEMERQIYGGRP